MPLKPLIGLISDVVIPLPAEDVHKSSGLALDLGSTIGKIIYRSNKEYKDGRPIKPQDDPSKGQVHFAMFPCSDIKGMINYIKDNCDLMVNEEGKIIVNSCGVGGAAYRKEIEGELSCKIDIRIEFDCFCKAFLALEKVLPEDELLIPTSQEIQAESDKIKASMKGVMDQAAAMSETKFTTESAEVKQEDRPRMLVMAGSGSVLMQINNDGTSSVLDNIYTAGRFMYGLCSILTEENDFKKLEKMASESDGRTSDMWWSDLMGDSAPEAEEGNIYEIAGEGLSQVHMFPFGKGVTVSAGHMKKGDLVWSVFSATASIHAQTVCTHVRYNKAKDVYYCGNTINTQIMRDLIIKKTNLTTMMLSEDQQFETHFLKNGGMYGAMGAFLQVKKTEAAK